MPQPSPSTRHGRSGLVVLALAVLAGACGSETVQPPLDGALVARLEAPGPVVAAVVDLTGVASVTADEGRAFTRATPTGLRTIVVLYEPGRIDLRLEPALVGGGAAGMTATLIEVADADGRVVGELEGYILVIDG